MTVQELDDRGVREVEHEITIAAPAPEVYRLVADVAAWPRVFPPTVHVEHLERGREQERIQIWATANGEPRTWTSRRTLHPDAGRVTFRQEVSTPPVASMGGEWIVEAAPDGGGTRVRLLHDYQAVAGDPAAATWIADAVDRNSRSELAALRDTAQRAASAADLVLSFSDAVVAQGSARDMYDFVSEADRWTERLPHVAAVELTEPRPGLQTLRMDTRAPDGSTHTTESVRVCFPQERIVYKQTTLPALMSLHTGYWLFEQAGDVATATSQHTVVLRPEAIAAVLGPDAGVPQAREYVRNALGANSRATLGHARDHAERVR